MLPALLRKGDLPVADRPGIRREEFAWAFELAVGSGS